MNPPIQLTHYAQSRDGRCLPACVRMVLSGLNIHLSENEIASVLGTRSFGTPASAIMRLEKLDLRVSYGGCSINQVIDRLDAAIPVILFVRTEFLDYWTEDLAHAVVAVAADPEKQALIHDPALDAGPTLTSWDGLIAAWAEFDYRCATISIR